MPAWNELTVYEAKACLEQGDGASRELVATLLAAIRARDPQIQGYLEVDEADALRQAEAADALRQEGQIEAAVEAYRQTLAIEPAHGRAYLALGNGLLRRNQRKEALRYWRHGKRVVQSPQSIERALKNLEGK